MLTADGNFRFIYRGREIEIRFHALELSGVRSLSTKLVLRVYDELRRHERNRKSAVCATSEVLEISERTVWRVVKANRE